MAQDAADDDYLLWQQEQAEEQREARQGLRDWADQLQQREFERKELEIQRRALQLQEQRQYQLPPTRITQCYPNGAGVISCYTF